MARRGQVHWKSLVIADHPTIRVHHGIRLTPVPENAHEPSAAYQMTKAQTLTRQQRRQLELDDRRDAKRDRRQRAQTKRPGASLPALTFGAIALGIVGVITYAVVTAPPPLVELNEPAASSPGQVADGLALGAWTAPVTVELWSDFQCPACGLFTKSMEPALVRDYVLPGKVRLVYHDLSFLGTESVDAAIAARVAAQSNKFWAYHDYLFANQRGEQQGAFAQPRLEAIATTIGLDLNEFRAAQRDPAVRQAVVEQQSMGASAGIAQTPTLIVGSQKFAGVPRTYADLQAAIDQALGEAGAL
jgi:protein-disulfide isomerase